jgi:predicted kinase
MRTGSRRGRPVQPPRMIPPEGPLVINPDDYLETESGRVYTDERNREAWDRAYADLEAALSAAEPGARLYVVMGVQGAGKTAWISQNAERLGAQAIVFDAAVPARRHRARLLELAARANVPAVGVLVQATLDEALLRNLKRTPDKIVPEEAIRSVHGMLEPPSEQEGFTSQMTVVSQPVSGSSRPRTREVSS